MLSISDNQDSGLLFSPEELMSRCLRSDLTIQGPTAGCRPLRRETEAQPLPGFYAPALKAGSHFPAEAQHPPVQWRRRGEGGHPVLSPSLKWLGAPSRPCPQPWWSQTQSTRSFGSCWHGTGAQLVRKTCGSLFPLLPPPAATTF